MGMTKKQVLPKLPKISKSKSKVQMTETSADTAPKAAPKAHKRVAKKSEAELLAKSKELAASYLVQRDGLDATTAMIVVNSMDPDSVHALNVEANTAVMERTGAPLVAPGPDVPPPSFTDIPTLLQFETVLGDSKEKVGFAELAVKTMTYGAAKNQNEKAYKAYKTILRDVMKLAEATEVECVGWILERYPGEARTLDPLKLIENGVSQAIIDKSYSVTPWEDVRFVKVKEAK